MNAKVVIVPRWGGTADDDWYPWLAAKLRGRAEVDFAPLLPLAWSPTIDETVAAVGRAVGRDAARTILVGHSTGCQAVVRWLATQPPRSVPAALCVAAWFQVDERFPGVDEWIDTPIDTKAAAAAVATPIRVLISDDDDVTADHRATAAEWRRRLGAKVRVVPGAVHFNARQQRDVLGELVRLLRDV